MKTFVEASIIKEVFCNVHIHSWVIFWICKIASKALVEKLGSFILNVLSINSSGVL